MSAKDLNTSLSIYTTRPHGRDGETTTYSLSLWMTMLAILAVWANVVIWGFIGLVIAAKVLV